MAVIINTTDAKRLLQEFTAATKKKANASGAINVWELLTSGHFRYLPDQYVDQAYFLPKVESTNLLKFFIIKPKNKTIDAFTYALYHGRLIETFLAHFAYQMIGIMATPEPTGSDSQIGS